MEYVSNDFPGSGGCLNTCLLLEHSLATVEKTVLRTGKGEASFSSLGQGDVPTEDGQANSAALGCQSNTRESRLQHKQASNCEGV